MSSSSTKVCTFRALLSKSGPRWHARASAANHLRDTSCHSLRVSASTRTRTPNRTCLSNRKCKVPASSLEFRLHHSQALGAVLAKVRASLLAAGRHPTLNRHMKERGDSLVEQTQKMCQILLKHVLVMKVKHSTLERKHFVKER